ncbi:MAG: ATP phosphoribosyltransferase [Dictyoglomus sp.]|nr:ATP phosphoribosyltransferase [Dictyoglomus sp.]MDW8188621.1 ATP phosphoribosyltransferase [Dictyoglomus sp.]
MNLKIAVPTGRLLIESLRFLKNFDKNLPEPSQVFRKLILQGDKFEVFLVKPLDIPTYVEEKITDLGIVGRDIIEEKTNKITILKKLNFGNCKMVIASYPHWELLKDEVVYVSTKYPNIAEKYLKKRWKGINFKVIKLNGSVELAPFAKISSCIIDLVETGNTLKENGLVIKEVLFESYACLIANDVSFVWRRNEILEFLKQIETLEEKDDKSNRL